MDHKLMIDGQIRFLKPSILHNISNSPTELNDQVKAFNQALISAREDIAKTKKVLKSENSVFQDVLLFYEMVLIDPVMIESIKDLITQSHLTASSAIELYFSDQELQLTKHDAYFQARKTDYQDVKNRLLNALSGTNMRLITPVKYEKPTLLLCEKLWVTDLMQMDFSHVRAVFTYEGSTHSHVAIILASYGIGYFIIPKIDSEIKEGDWVQFNPSTLKIKHANILQNKEGDPLQNAYSHVLPQGIELWPAINLMNELTGENIKEIHGIGLIRTEWLFMGRNYPPDEIEQILYYQGIINSAKGKPVYFRLLDVENDKPLPYVNQKLQGAEFLLNNPEITHTQLKALYTVSINNPIGIILPMVKIKAEVDQIWQWFDQIQKSSPSTIAKGIMVETLEAINSIDQFRNLDFMMLGTNDLASAYANVARTSADFNDDNYLNPAMVRAIYKVMNHCKKHHIRLVLCGDAANRKTTLLVYLSLGVKLFAPSIKNIELYHHYSQETLRSLKEISKKILLTKSAQDIHQLLAPFLHD